MTGSAGAGAGANLAGLLWARAEEASDHEFLIVPEVDLTWSYADVCASSATFARRLPERGTVGCMLPNGAHLLVATFAGWAVGCRVALINPALSSEERDRALEDVGARLLVTDSEGFERHGEPRGVELVLAEDVPELCAPSVAGPIGSVAPVEPGSDAVIVFTSGTTGRAKAAALTHDRLRSAADSLARSLRGRAGPYPVAPPDKPPTLIAGPLAQTGGVNALVFALVVGRRLLIIRKFRPDQVADLAARYQLDAFMGTPTMLQMLATYPGDIRWPTLRTVISGGAPLTSAVKSRFERRFGVPIIQIYGQTETGYIAGYSPQDVREGRVRDGAVGKIYDGVELLIRDEGGKALPPGQVGEIVVRTPYSMRGYAGVSDEAPGPDPGGRGWVATGDLGYVDADGYLFLVGRKTEMIICGGFNVYPAEVEQALLAHDGVVEAAVFGQPDERLGEVPVAAVVPRDDGVTEAGLIEFCRRKLAHYKAPRGIRFVPELPKTESTKVLRRELEEAWRRASGAGERGESS